MAELIDDGSESHLVDFTGQTVVTYHHGRTDVDDVVAVVRFDAVHATAFKCLVALVSPLCLQLEGRVGALTPARLLIFSHLLKANRALETIRFVLFAFWGKEDNEKVVLARGLLSCVLTSTRKGALSVIVVARTDAQEIVSAILTIDWTLAGLPSRHWQNERKNGN